MKTFAAAMTLMLLLASGGTYYVIEETSIPTEFQSYIMKWWINPPTPVIILPEHHEEPCAAPSQVAELHSDTNYLGTPVNIFIETECLMQVVIDWDTGDAAELYGKASNAAHTYHERGFYEVIVKAQYRVDEGNQTWATWYSQELRVRIWDYAAQTVCKECIGQYYYEEPYRELQELTYYVEQGELGQREDLRAEGQLRWRETGEDPYLHGDYRLVLFPDYRVDWLFNDPHRLIPQDARIDVEIHADGSIMRSQTLWQEYDYQDTIIGGFFSDRLGGLLTPLTVGDEVVIYVELDGELQPPFIEPARGVPYYGDDGWGFLIDEWDYVVKHTYGEDKDNLAPEE